MNLLKRKPSEILSRWRWWPRPSYNPSLLDREDIPGMADLAVQVYGEEMAENIMKYFKPYVYQNGEINFPLPEEIRNCWRHAPQKGVEQMLSALGHRDAKRIMYQLSQFNVEVLF